MGPHPPVGGASPQSQYSTDPTLTWRLELSLPVLSGSYPSACYTRPESPTSQVSQAVDQINTLQRHLVSVLTPSPEQYVTMWIATAVEIWIAIIGACLPTVLPACRKLRYGTAREGSSGANRSLTMYQGQTPGKGHGVHTIGSGGKSGPRSHIHPVGEGTFELLDATQCDGCSEQEVDLVGGSQEEGFQRRVFGGKGYNSSP